MKLHYGDMTDSSSLVKIIGSVKPTEIYNLAAQSHVKVNNLIYRNYFFGGFYCINILILDFI